LVLLGPAWSCLVLLGPTWSRAYSTPRRDELLTRRNNRLCFSLPHPHLAALSCCRFPLPFNVIAKAVFDETAKRRQSSLLYYHYYYHCHCHYYYYYYHYYYYRYLNFYELFLRNGSSVHCLNPRRWRKFFKKLRLFIKLLFCKKLPYSTFSKQIIKFSAEKYRKYSVK
jgi:hypothetical protein